MKLLVMAMLMVTPATSMEMVAESPKPDTTVVTDGQANREISGEKTICQDRVHQAESDDSGVTLNRGTASADQPPLIAAVDYRLNGCSMMMMHNNTADLRPIPAPSEEAELTPAS